MGAAVLLALLPKQPKKRLLLMWSSSQLMNPNVLLVSRLSEALLALVLRRRRTLCLHCRRPSRRVSQKMTLRPQRKSWKQLELRSPSNEDIYPCLQISEVLEPPCNFCTFQWGFEAIPDKNRY